MPPGTPLDFSLLGEPHEQGLVFKWGSLVGIRMPSEGANGSSPFVAGDVVFRPTGFTTTVNTWANVPYCETDFGNYDNTATDHLADVNDPVAGIGDICRHMGVIDSANWRMPTAKEWEDLYRNGLQNGGEAIRIDNNSDWSDGSLIPLHGYAFGQHQTRVAITSNTQVDNADPNTDGALFLPASGWRNPNVGAISEIGFAGIYWSSTAFTHANSLLMKFYSTNVLPQYSDVRTYGLSIRCIRE